MDLAQRLETVEAENDALRERVAELETILYGDGWHVPLEWGLTASEARVMGVLISREFATKNAIMAALYRDLARDEAEAKIVDVFICKMRKKVAPFGVTVLTIWGEGYRLPPDQRAALSAGAVSIDQHGAAPKSAGEAA